MPNGTQPPTSEFESSLTHARSNHVATQHRVVAASTHVPLACGAVPVVLYLRLWGLVGASAGLTGVNFALMSEHADSVTLCLLVGWERCACACVSQPLLAHTLARTNHPHLGDAHELVGFENAVVGG